MTTDDWDVLRRLRRVVEKGQPDDWFITAKLTNGVVARALAAVERKLHEQELLLTVADEVSKECRALEAKLIVLRDHNRRLFSDVKALEEEIENQARRELDAPDS